MSSPSINLPPWAEALFDQATGELLPVRYFAIHGGRGCVHPDTLLDTPNGPVRIKDWNGGQIYSYKNGKVITTYATPPVRGTFEDLYEVKLASGKSVTCTDQHKFLTSSNKWVQLSSLTVGDSVVSCDSLPFDGASHAPPRSTSDIDPLEFHGDVQRCSQKHANYLGGYFFDSRQYGPPLPFSSGSVPVSSPSQDGALQHIHHVSMRVDATLPSHGGIHSPISDHVASHGAPFPVGGKNSVGLGNCSDDKPSGSSLVSPPAYRLFPWCSSLVELVQGFYRGAVCLCTLSRLVQIPRKALGKLRAFANGISLFRPSKSPVVDEVTFDYITGICKVNPHYYYDLHVPETNCYFAQGILHHNSSKSRTMATILVLEAGRKPSRILCTREVQKSIRDSVKRLLDDEIERLGLTHFFTSTDSEIRGKNGSLFIFAGLSHNIDSVKSMEGITHCWCEEAQTLSQNSLETLDPTIRAPHSKMFFTWNPKSPKDPVDVMFRGPEPPPRSVILQVNYTDNPWFPDVLRDQMEYDKRTDYGKYQHVWEGNYLVRSNANVFQNWRIEEFEAPEDAFFRFGCDWGFSVDPTVLIRNFNIGRKIYIDHEAYQVGCEIDDTPALFATVPESDAWPIIADSASPERISYMRKHGYPKMMKALKGRKSIEEGIAFLQSHEIIVHPRCEAVVNELMNYSYRIDPITNEITNVLNDKDNHCVAEGTLVTTDRGCIPVEHIRPGDKVLTRAGYERVYAVHDNGIRETLVIRTNHGSLTCTPDHKILTGRGWLQADALRYNDEVLYIGVNQCKSKQLSGTDINTTDTQNRPTGQLGITTGEVVLRKITSFTGMFGCITTVPFLLDTTFTMWTETLPITTFLIYSVCRQVNTSNGTGLRSAMKNSAQTLIKYGSLRKFGTLLRKGVSGIVNTSRTLLQKLGRTQYLKTVISADQSLPARHTETVTDSAPTSANLRGVEIKEWMMLTAHASTAGQCLEQINTQKLRLVIGRVQTISCGKEERVYDLSVENHHEFVANGVLIQNCIDALRYSQEAVRRTVKKQSKDLDNFVPLPSRNCWNR